jgi:alpha-beta hydrolase superfamily lysophospholipase
VAWLFAIYAGFCVAGCIGYRTFLYPAPSDAAAFTLPPDARLLTLHAEDGVVTRAAQLPSPVPDGRTIVIFHGNGETMENRAPLAQALQLRGFGVVLAEYRGYGLARASARPDEAGLYRDALAVLDELTRQGIGRDKVALLGISLGTGVAVEMAARGRATALVLISPYTSITAMASRALPLLPTRWLCPDKYDSLSKAPRVNVPTLVVHGDQDEVVPFAMGQQIAAAIPGARIKVVPGGHHNDLFRIDELGLEDAIAEAARR